MIIQIYLALLEGLSRGLRGRPVGAGRGRVGPEVQCTFWWVLGVGRRRIGGVRAALLVGGVGVRFSGVMLLANSNGGEMV